MFKHIVHSASFSSNDDIIVVVMVVAKVVVADVPRCADPVGSGTGFEHGVVWHFSRGLENLTIKPTAIARNMVTSTYMPTARGLMYMPFLLFSSGTVSCSMPSKLNCSRRPTMIAINNPATPDTKVSLAINAIELVAA
jgi:hypothetical protein